jgi:DNA-binding PadR family transcriptional regulator
LAYQRLENKLTKENLWLYITRLLLERPMYAYEISKTLESRFGLTAATVTTYVVLYKMEREGLIRVEQNPTLRRPDRKYYAVTDRGKETFESGKSLIEETLKKLS